MLCLVSDKITTVVAHNRAKLNISYLYDHANCLAIYKFEVIFGLAEFEYQFCLNLNIKTMQGKRL